MSIFTILENRKKILGMNERQLIYVRRYNKTRAVQIADDKILTKKILNASEIPTPKLLAVISNFKQLEEFDFNVLPASFVVKPVKGLEGGGVEIFYNRDENGNWIRADKSRVSQEQLKQYIKDILDGRYSLAQQPDQAMFEERVKIHKAFRYYVYKGTPDVRIIVFNHIPTMSYIRLPTKESEGKANLIKGALGLGIDMATGITTSGIHGKSGEIEYIPGTKLSISGLKIPYWNKILEYAIKVQQVTNLNFAAIDFLIDRDLGPLIVELNARPGLSIQLANKDGLRWRLRKTRGIKVKSVEKGIRLAKDMFGGEIEEEIENISGKEVIGIYENVKLYGKNMQEIEAKAKIDTGADSTSIDKQLALNLGFKEILDAMEAKNIPDNLPREESLKLIHDLSQELLPKYPDLIDIIYVKSSHGSSLRPYVKISIKIKDTLFETSVTVFDRSHLVYPIIVGRKSLTKFLVDPSKTRT